MITLETIKADIVKTLREIADYIEQSDVQVYGLRVDSNIQKDSAAGFEEISADFRLGIRKQETYNFVKRWEDAAIKLEDDKRQLEKLKKQNDLD
jgi:hypothetical protein